MGLWNEKCYNKNNGFQFRNTSYRVMDMNKKLWNEFLKTPQTKKEKVFNM